MRLAEREGTAEARLAAQGGGRPRELAAGRGGLAAAGEADAVSLHYQTTHTAWENLVWAALGGPAAGAVGPCEPHFGPRAQASDVGVSQFGGWRPV